MLSEYPKYSCLGKWEYVLILIVMEHALGGSAGSHPGSRSRVLILIVMEHALGE